MIDARLSLFEQRCVDLGRVSYSAPPPLAPQGPTGAPHRALLIPEILENIIRVASPTIQWAAWYVCHSSRSTTEYIWRQQYHKPFPCEPVEYAQNIDPNLRWLPATETEISQFEKITLKDYSEMWNPNNSNPDRFNYIPARVSQDLSFPESA